MPDWSAYKAKEREARKQAGFKRVEVWAHADDAEKVREYAALLERKRLNKPLDRNKA